MNDESFVRLPSSTLIILYGQVGNIRSRLITLTDVTQSLEWEGAETVIAELNTELDFLESYLPQRVDDIPF